MKILSTETQKIIAFGEFARATNSGEIVLDTEDMTVKQILEIAAVNEVVISAKKKADIIAQLNDHLVEHNTEVNTMSESEKLEGIVVAGFEAELSDNDIKKEMFEAGCDFGDINKTFNAIVADKTLRLSPKDRNTKAAEFLEGYVPGTVEEHLGKVAALEDFLGCKTTQAGASMRAWAKANEVELPKAPKASKVDPGFRGNQKVIADYALANRDVTLEQLITFAAENIEATKGGKDNSRGYAVSVYNAIIFARSWAGEGETATEEVEMEEAA